MNHPMAFLLQSIKTMRHTYVRETATQRVRKRQRKNENTLVIEILIKS